MASVSGNSEVRSGLPGLDQAKKKKVMFQTMASTMTKEVVAPSGGGLESRMSVASSPGSSILNSSTNQTPTKSEKKKKKGVTPDMARTFRFNLSFKDETSNHKHTCTEFNWLDLVAAEEKARLKTKMGELHRVLQQKKKAELTESDPFKPLNPYASDDEDQIQALAKKFEAKYGSASERVKKKKKARKVDDYADLGYGYDTDDSFIDDSEVHDELVPETVTTAHGGFYINTGVLEFKPRESADEDSDLEAVIKAGEMEAKAVKRKRIKTKDLKDEDSSDDPENRQRGTINPLFGTKKSKNNYAPKSNGALNLNNGH